MLTTRPIAEDFAHLPHSLLYRTPETVPLHFSLDGTSYEGLASCSDITVKESASAALHCLTVEGKHPAGISVCVEFREYRDFPAVEWLAFFTNIGNAPTPILTDVSFGALFPPTARTLWHGNGDTCGEDGYTWEKDFLESTALIEPEDGTSCRGAFPYMRLVGENAVFSIAIGWPGHWRASFASSEKNVSLTVGQARCHTRLLPGETMRTPRLTVLASAGEELRAANLWRRWYLACILPRENGAPLPPKLCMHYIGEGGMPEFTGATENGQCAALRAYHENGIHPDIWWVDAGWYPCSGDWPTVGTWTPDPVRFPDGLRPLGDACRAYDTDFLLWFEPERARRDTEIFEAHPEWLLSRQRDAEKTDAHYLVDLGNPACCDFLIDRIDAIVKESGVRIYRQDFNYFRPEQWWQENEAEDRIGMRENLHLQGMLRLWDTLLARNPGLLIDCCASGGRRNDLEMMRRSVPLHYTDVGYGNHPIKQKQHYLMFSWIPYFRAHNMSWDTADGSYGKSESPHGIDAFAYHAAMAPSLTDMLRYDATETQNSLARRMQPIWRKAAALMLRADYYPLSECRASAEDVYAMQFHDPEQGDGFVQILYNVRAEEKPFTAQLKALLPDGTYRFRDAESGEEWTLAGESAALTLTLPPRSAKLFFYEKI